jgi:ubiquinone/menaquinone biosynthesis C-methylase UbiE
MSRSAHRPFDSDIETYGRYQYTGGDRFSSRRANRRFSDMILAAADFRGRRVVDVGCGDGTYTLLLAGESGAASVLGVDPSQPAIAAAQARHADERIRFRCGTAATLVDEGALFDVAVYRGVIHHVTEPQLEIASALRLARQVVFLEPNGLNPVLKVLERVSAYHREHDERSYAASTLRGWIVRGGGRVRSLSYFGLVPHFSPEWLARTGAAMEPLVERIRGLRVFACGQLLIVAESPDPRGPAATLP